MRKSEIDSGLLHTLTRISGLFHLRFVNSIITIDFIVQSLSRSNNNNNGFNSWQISYIVANGWWIKRYTGNTHTQADSDTDSALPVAFPSAESSYEIPYETGFWFPSFFLFLPFALDTGNNNNNNVNWVQQQLSLYVLHAPFAFFFVVYGCALFIRGGFLSTNFFLRGNRRAMSSLCLVPFLAFLHSVPSCSAPQESRFATNSTRVETW